jgi:hypothetical protein
VSDEAAFVVALFRIDDGRAQHRLAVDASHLVAVLENADDAVDVAPLLGLCRFGPVGRAARFAWDSGTGVLQLGPRVDIVASPRDAVFALPMMLDGLERRGVLGFIRHDGAYWTLCDPRHFLHIDESAV